MHNPWNGGAAATLALALGITGCQVNFKASATASTEATTDDSDAEQREAQTAGDIRYREGRLDYKGVINFEYNKAELRSDPETQQTLKLFKDFLDKHENVTIEVEGHTDSRGSDEYNRKLSDRRAASIRKWLIDNGIAADRITSVGKGEDEPQLKEPDGCDDNVPEDPSPCEQAWGANRRVMFVVTAGAETLPEEPAPEPEPEPEPAPVVEERRDECPWLWGGHLNALGPNSWVTVAGAVQPGVCWLEPSLGLGLGFGGIDAEEPPADTQGDGSYVSLTVPLRARIWFMDRHSLLGDVGLALSFYRIGADLTDSAGETGNYSRHSTALLGNLGVGYGYRPNGAQAGFRLGIVIGGLIHFTDLSDSELDVPAGFSAADATNLRTALDRDSNRLTDLEPYGEISFGMLF